jgi:hypothetical protein
VPSGTLRLVIVTAVGILRLCFLLHCYANPMRTLSLVVVVGLIWMSYVDEIAWAIRCLVPPAVIPDGDTTVLFRIYAVLALARGERVLLEDVHDAWAAWMSGRDPEHRSLKPFGVLAPEVHESDRPYLDAIRAVARERRLGR